MDPQSSGRATRLQRLQAAPIRAGRVVRNAIIDVQHGKLLVGRSRSSYEHLGSRHVENSDYKALDLVFDGTLRPDDVLVDVGCGKGRVINWWLDNGYAENRIYGLELDPEIAATTQQRLRRHDNVTILAGDAVELLPVDATALYLYNPFDASVMARFIERAKSIYRGSAVRILYSNPKQVDLFEADPDWRVQVRAIGNGRVAPFDPLAVIELA